MNKRQRSIAILGVCIAFQCILVGGLYLREIYPLWRGAPIKLKIRPVDPRSLFRGQYVRLNYEINQLPRAMAKDIPDGLRRGSPVYVSLEQHEDHWSPVAMSIEPPAEGKYIRGKLRYAWRGRNSFRVEYGIESFFAPPDQARELGLQLRGRRVQYAEVMLARDGKALVSDLLQE